MFFMILSPPDTVKKKVNARVNAKLISYLLQAPNILEMGMVWSLPPMGAKGVYILLLRRNLSYLWFKGKSKGESFL